MKRVNNEYLHEVKKEISQSEKDLIEKRKKRQQKKLNEKDGQIVAPIILILSILISLIVWIFNKN